MKKLYWVSGTSTDGKIKYVPGTLGGGSAPWYKPLILYRSEESALLAALKADRDFKPYWKHEVLTAVVK